MQPCLFLHVDLNARLPQAPDPKTVRPLPILRQTLEHLKKKWRTENNYAWVCDQFKSMRQDLTVCPAIS